MIDTILLHPDGKQAVVDETEGVLTYGELKQFVGRLKDALAELPQYTLAISLLPNGIACVLFYLGALAARRAHVLVDPGSAAAEALVGAYAPTLLAVKTGAKVPEKYSLWKDFGPYGLSLYIRESNETTRLIVHPSLALMLTTSGSTGNPKLVRLSENNLRSNAESIIEYLRIGVGEVCIQSLPLHYSYGLSLLNTHLLAGGTVAISRQSFMRPEFWAFATAAKATSFAGVPYMYETLHKLRMDPFSNPTIRTATQAGGGLKTDLVEVFNDSSNRAGKRFFVMYGQTEATARIAYVPHVRLRGKIGSIGIAIPRGTLSLREEPSTGEKEIIYSGPNVMLGYAECIADLALADVQGGVLSTGDLGTVDDDGYYRITGRLTRFAKLFGRRVHLGDIESEAEKLAGCSVAAVENGNSLRIYVESGGVLQDPQKSIKAALAQKLGVPPAAISVAEIARIPRTSAGKKNYRDLVA